MATKKKAKKRSSKKVSSGKVATQKKSSKKKAQKATVDDRKTCFVMMPFIEPFDIYYSAIYRPAIESKNLKPVRADDLFRPSVIVSDMWDMIKEADVLLAELTTKNANVFYELGLAHAVGKPVILVSETIEDVPFDLQQLRVLMYNKDDPNWGEALRNDISGSLEEVLETPLDAVPSIFRKKTASLAPEQDEVHSRIDNLESQVRLLRANAPKTAGSRSRPNVAKLRHQLNDIEGPNELDELFQSARNDYPLGLIFRLIRDAEHIPDSEVERLTNDLDSKK